MLVKLDKAFIKVAPIIVNHPLLSATNIHGILSEETVNLWCSNSCNSSNSTYQPVYLVQPGITQYLPHHRTFEPLDYGNSFGMFVITLGQGIWLVHSLLWNSDDIFHTEILVWLFCIDTFQPVIIQLHIVLWHLLWLHSSCHD